ncbi:hypothetical protein [Psychroserpens damuponensis]|uniref:hypothetical protein n=1 Tax=Psychroserpens damuponensis TaxID=943936 RepID=UPI000A429232|nr:hypothetical protein [Psychroserpens damuponensis]
MNSLLNTKMTKSTYLSLIILLCVSALGYSQENYLTKSKSNLTTLGNQTISTSDIIKSKKTIVVFIKSYNDEHAFYVNKLISENEKGSFPNDTEIVAICYDNLGTFKQVKPNIDKHNWKIRVYIDKDHKLVNYDYLNQQSLLSSSFNTKPSILTLIFDNNTLVSQFYGNKHHVDASFFGNRYGSVILD